MAAVADHCSLQAKPALARVIPWSATVPTRSARALPCEKLDLIDFPQSSGIAGHRADFMRRDLQENIRHSLRL